MKISDLSVEGLLITGWLYKKIQEHKNKPPEPPQKHPKGCYIAVLLFFLIGLALIFGDYFVGYYRSMDGQKSHLFELYAARIPVAVGIWKRFRKSIVPCPRTTRSKRSGSRMPLN